MVAEKINAKYILCLVRVRKVFLKCYAMWIWKMSAISQKTAINKTDVDIRLISITYCFLLIQCWIQALFNNALYELYIMNRALQLDFKSIPSSRHYITCLNSVNLEELGYHLKELTLIYACQ